MSHASDNPLEFNSDLIDLHLGALSDKQRAALLARVQADPDLSRQHAELTEICSALDTVRATPPVPRQLARRSAERIRAAGLGPRLVRGGAARGAATPPERGIPLFARVNSLRDVLAVAAMIVLAVGVGVPSLLRVRERSQRTLCSANLAQLGQGLAAYASAFNDNLPFAGWGNRDVWQASPDPSMRRLPNRAHMYRLLEARTVRDPARFVCPARGDVPMSADQIALSDDFTESRNVSYGYQNMAGVRPTLNDSPDTPIMADDNPLFEDGLLLGLGYGAGANSRSHGGRGQNVLTIGGRVRWLTTPDCGVDGDNIWTLQDVRDYTGREGPKKATDSHLLK
jgi:hypothetical protein